MKACGITDIGKVRKENQDSFLVEYGDDRIVAVVCDGMGGARSGNIASALGAECFCCHLENCFAEEEPPAVPELIREAVAYSNVRVYDRAFTDFTCEGMGTTLVGGVFMEDKAYIANVGDSRAYLVSEGEIRQITTDHSYVEELVQQGIITREAARKHPKRNYITRALGLAREVDSDIYTLNIRPGSVVLLCTDGLSNLVSEQEMLELSMEHSDPEQLCASLMELALGREATDNVSVAAVCY